MDRPKLYSPERTVNAQDARKVRHAVSHEPATLPMPARPPKLEWLDVRNIVDEVCADLHRELAATQIETTIDVPSPLGAVADRAMIRQAVTNLVRNALEAMPRGGRLEITSYCGPRGLELEVADSGPGLSDDALSRAFEPFYTTKRDAAGLGLAQVRHVAQAHGGDVLAMNCPEGGAAFTLRLPARAHASAA
ncbi:MAG: PAS domain-containing sensor histidine kinase [Pirellulales bacterium]